MWTVVLIIGVAAIPAGGKTWTMIANQRSRERSVDRLAQAREKGAEFDLPAAIEHLHAPADAPAGRR